MHLSVIGDKAVLSIARVSVNHYGDYFIWAENKYGGWEEGNLSFTLVPAGKIALRLLAESDVRFWLHFCLVHEVGLSTIARLLMTAKVIMNKCRKLFKAAIS